MVKKNNKTKEGPEVVANSGLEYGQRGDLKNLNINRLIRTIRGQKVMVDFDLAMLYGVQNKRLNEQVKRNIKRFPEDFMFQLTKEEWNTLRSQILRRAKRLIRSATAKLTENQTIEDLKSQNATSSWGGTRKLPYAFTRERIDDRFLIIDDKVYLLGASVKDIGVGLCAVTEMQAAPELILGLQK